MKLLVASRDGSTAIIDITEPVQVFECADPKFTMAYLRSGDGTDLYFNKDDGTYDGWGRAMCDESPDDSQKGK